MKKARIFSILVLCFLLSVMFINRDKLVSFAKEDDIEDLDVYNVVKNNSSFVFEGTDLLRCVYFSYYDELGNFVVRDSKCKDSTNAPIQVTINNDISNYWAIGDIYYESFGIYYTLLAFEYKAPTYQLDCNPNKITMDTTATCTVTAKTYYNITNVEFDLNLDDFTIYDEVELEDVVEFHMEDKHYVLTPKNIPLSTVYSGEIAQLKSFSEPVNLKLMQFKIKTEKEQEVNITDNIKLINLEYNDLTGKVPYGVLTSTINQDKDDTKSDEKEEKPNPKTVDRIIIAAVLMVISFALVLTISYKHKKIS